MSDTYKKIPALAMYIDRIGAEELNFRRFIIKEDRGAYYVERCLIRIMADGEVRCSKKEYAPTDDEAAAILIAVRSAGWPKAIGVMSTKGLMRRVGSIYYEFIDRRDGSISFVQERVEPKAFIPWTYFSDGEWRRMEPDDGLPFWKPRERRKARVMIHEGAKGAVYMERMIAEGGRVLRKGGGEIIHPWFAELAEYEHWGMVGGALAPHRSVYDELRREKFSEVIYVCDNDYPGRAALQDVSRMYGLGMRGIKFNALFPVGWDLADPMPDCLFGEDGRFLGVGLKSYHEAATWATERLPPGDGGGKGLIVAKGVFREEWVHSIKPEVFIHTGWPNIMYSGNEFNNRIRPYSDVDDVAKLLKADGAGKGAVLKYDPGMRSGMYVGMDGERYINTHVGSGIVAAEGNGWDMWLEFMKGLIEDEGDRLEVLRWCATLIARPALKMLYGLLLISETQGVGKGTLGEKILAPLVGEWNVSYPAENEIVDSNYNYWLAHRRLAVVHEIYAGHSTKGYNRLKSIITDRYITVSKKYQANYEIDNWIHIFACSNSMRALHMSMDDRRWFVPKVTEVKREVGWWKGLNEWLVRGGGLQAIRAWADVFLAAERAVLPGEPAPWSLQKGELVEESFSPGQLYVSQLLGEIKEKLNGNGQGVLIADTDLVSAVRDKLYDGRHNDRLEKPSTLRKVAKKLGWFINPDRAVVKAWGTLYSKPHLICSEKGDSLVAPGVLAEEGRTLVRISDFVNKTGAI